MSFPAPDGTSFVSLLGTGSVFVAALVREGDEVVVCKRLLPRMRSEPAARAAMAREGLSLSLARHPALPALRRVGADGHGPFVIETRVEGMSFRALADAWRARHEPVPPRLVAYLAVAAAEALAGIHELADARGPLGLSHGDVTPDHVFVGPIGDVRFVDLGAARWAAMDRALGTEDRGTLPFAAPEVARGEVPPDQAADVYALGATILALAAGGPISAAESDAAMLLEIGEDGLSAALVARAVGLSASAQDALRRAIARDPVERITRARELARALSG
ncbi:serine/threonine protein kinase [Minicystis rosea]|nr:serine/threonine protein kinase [Minicystis rosea]